MQEKRFIVSKELGKLAKWLRIVGYDSVYYDHGDEAGFIIQALRESRVILARSPEIIKHKGVKVVVVEHDLVEDQLDQVVRELGLEIKEEQLFTRCVECSTPLEKATREEAEKKVPEYVFRTNESFKKCGKCGKIFWKGTHWDMVGNWLRSRGLAK